MLIEKHNELFSSKEMKTCQWTIQKTWYLMPLEVFMSFIFQASIYLFESTL